MRTVSDSPELDAQLLACHGLKISLSRLYAFPEQTLDVAASDSLNSLLRRRLDGEPIAYITGTREFWSIPLMVNSGALVPRPDTEVLVEKALALADAAPSGFILDLGTGSGAIAIAIAHELPGREVVAIERSADAMDVALVNSASIKNLHLLRASWLECVADSQAAMIISNPPYIANNDVHLNTLRHEPRQALVSGNNGLDDIAHIIAESVRAAKERAPLVIEHGYDQATDVRQLLLDHGYLNVGTEHDLSGHERISFGLVSKKPL